MNIFNLVRANITARDAAEYYGIKVNKNGMACCPFHNDKHPSLKLDKRFHCFGCQADGDAVDFVARLFGIRKYDAAQKLLDDFGMVEEAEAFQNRKKCKRIAHAGKKKSEHQFRVSRTEKLIESWLLFAEDTLLKYQLLLLTWKEDYRPAMEDAEWHPLFEEALKMLSINTYHLEIVLKGSDEDKLDFFVMRERG